MEPELRMCIDCGERLPLTREFFGQTSSGNFRNQCRSCKRKYSASWAVSNPELIAAKWGRQNARRSAAGPKSWNESDVARLRMKLKDRCAYCDVELDGKGEIDHMIALEVGGTNELSNLTLACRPCNRAKGSRNANEFVQWRRERNLKWRRLKCRNIE